MPIRITRRAFYMLQRLKRTNFEKPLTEGMCDDLESYESARGFSRVAWSGDLNIGNDYTPERSNVSHEGTLALSQALHGVITTALSEWYVCPTWRQHLSDSRSLRWASQMPTSVGAHRAQDFGTLPEVNDSSIEMSLYPSRTERRSLSALTSSFQCPPCQRSRPSRRVVRQ